MNPSTWTNFLHTVHIDRLHGVTEDTLLCYEIVKSTTNNSVVFMQVLRLNYCGFFFFLPVYFVLKYCRQIYMIFVRYLERLFLLYHIFSTFVWCEALNPSIRQVACLKKMINGQRKNAWIEFRYIPDVEFNFSMLMCLIIYVNEISNCLVFSF